MEDEYHYPDWIDVRHKLPSAGYFCLLYSPDQGIGHFIGYLEDDGCWKCYVPTEGRAIDIEWVTHWQPVIPPPMSDQTALEDPKPVD